MANMATLPDLGEQLRPFIEALPAQVRPRFLARLERGAADRYRAWAAKCRDAQQADGLRACAAREDEIAARVEKILPSPPDEQQQITGVLPEIARLYLAAFAHRPLAEQYAIQAASERRGATVWRAFASSLFGNDAAARATLLACADLEEQSAQFLETLVRRSA